MRINTATERIVNIQFDAAPAGAPAVVRVAQEQFAPHYCLERCYRPNYVLLFILKGVGIYANDAGEKPLRRGMVFSFAPGVRHMTRCAGTEPLAVIRVVLEGTGWREQFGRCLGAQCTALDPPPCCDIESLFRTILATAIHGGWLAPELCRHYAEIVLLRLGQARLLERSGSSPAAMHVQRARNLMDARCAGLARAVEVAAELGLSPEHLSRIFRAETGETISAYLMRRRTQVASQLLLETDDPVHEIARQLGFSEVSSFSRAFRRATGYPPRRYRRK